MTKPTSVDAYIASFPPPTQALLKTLRATIRAAAPDADEAIAYGMPAYRQGGHPLVYFAAYAGHLGFYPTSTGIAAFVDELAGFAASKGAVQFPLDAPLPVALVRRMVRWKLAEVMAMAGKKPAQKKPAQKKPAQKKPAQKKPAQKKPAQKKPAQKKP